jgi:hypothetical protein
MPWQNRVQTFDSQAVVSIIRSDGLESLVDELGETASAAENRKANL